LRPLHCRDGIVKATVPLRKLQENIGKTPDPGLSASGIALSLLAMGPIAARLDRNRVIARKGDRRNIGGMA
jgi:hypothetical protein